MVLYELSHTKNKFPELNSKAIIKLKSLLK